LEKKRTARNVLGNKNVRPEKILPPPPTQIRWAVPEYKMQGFNPKLACPSPPFIKLSNQRCLVTIYGDFVELFCCVG
jgi:hypothetical protein